MIEQFNHEPLIQTYFLKVSPSSYTGSSLELSETREPYNELCKKAILIFSAHCASVSITFDNICIFLFHPQQIYECEKQYEMQFFKQWILNSWNQRMHYYFSDQEWEEVCSIFSVEFCKCTPAHLDVAPGTVVW